MTKVYVAFSGVALVIVITAIMLVVSDVIAPGVSVVIGFPIALVSVPLWTAAIRAQNRANLDAIARRAEAEELAERDARPAEFPEH